VAEHGHQRRDAAPARGEKKRRAVVLLVAGVPDEIAADRPAQLDSVADAQPVS